MRCDCVSLQTRYILAVMVLLGQITNYVLRLGLNIALVEMVVSDARKTSNDTVGECVRRTTERTTDTGSPHGSFSNLEYNDQIYNNTGTEDEGFLWDQYTQGLILGSFAWGYILTQAIGGRLAELYGAKRLFSFGLLGAAFLNFLIPTAAKFDYRLLIAVKFLIGVCEGPTWPSLQTLTARWVPPGERSRFIGSYFGTLLGVVITYPLSGVIIYYLNWESTFYIYGAWGIVWFCIWQYLVFDTPDKHPRISTEEKDYIFSSFGQYKPKDKPPPVPWRSMIKSKPLYAILFFDFCNTWGIGVLLSKGPTFLKEVLGFNIMANGFLSALPSLSRFFGAQIFGYVADWIQMKKYLSRTKTRKLCVALAGYVPAIFLVGLSYVGCNSTLAVVLLTVSFGFNGAYITGLTANQVDIAPNFSGTVNGISQSVGTIPAFFLPVVVGLLINENQTLSRWRIVFCMVAAVYCLGATVFAFLASGKVQPWNNIEAGKKEEDKDEAISAL